jgi:hypothetical protein
MGSLAADDQPCSLGPAGEVNAIGDLSDLGALALGSVAVDRALPSSFGRLADRPAHPLVDLVADRERMPAERQSEVKAWVRPPMSVRARISRSRSWAGSCSSASCSTSK